MSTLAKSHPQPYLVSIDKATFKQIKHAVKRHQLSRFTTNAWQSGDKYGWILKTEPGPDGIYLLIEHYVSRPEGGLALAYKVNALMYDAFKQL